jgi:hypothetical protein
VLSNPLSRNSALSSDHPNRTATRACEDGGRILISHIAHLCYNPSQLRRRYARCGHPRETAAERANPKPRRVQGGASARRDGAITHEPSRHGTRRRRIARPFLRARRRRTFAGRSAHRHARHGQRARSASFPHRVRSACNVSTRWVSATIGFPTASERPVSVFRPGWYSPIAARPITRLRTAAVLHPAR